MSGGNYSFDYDKGELINAKKTILQATNLCSTANSLLKKIQKPTSIIADWGQIKSESGVSSYPCFSGASPSAINKVDFNLLTTSQEKLSSLNKNITDFDGEVDRVIGAIVSYLDADLAEELVSALKSVEKTVVKEMLDKGLAGEAINIVQLYNLLSKYKNDKSLELTDDQRKLFDYMITTVEAKAASNGLDDIGECIIFVTPDNYEIEPTDTGAEYVDGDVVTLRNLSTGAPVEYEGLYIHEVVEIDNMNSEQEIDEMLFGEERYPYIAVKMGAAACKRTGQQIKILLPNDAVASGAVESVEMVSYSPASDSDSIQDEQSSNIVPPFVVPSGQDMSKYQDTQTVEVEIKAEEQKSQMERWKILEDTQTKCFEIQQDVTVNQARTQNKMFARWDAYIRH